MLGFHDVAVVLCPAAADLSAVVIAEALHGKAAFQDVLPHRVNDFLKLGLERRAVQLLWAPRPPSMPELISIASEVHSDMTDGASRLSSSGCGV